MNHFLKGTVISLSLVCIVLIVWWRTVYALDVPRSWDQVDFSLALSRFDLFAMQPHFPGYPYFILGGMLVNSWVENPSVALSYFNSILLFSAIYPLYSISRSVLSKSLSVLTIAVIQSMVFMNVMTIQPMSEVSAVSVLWWYIWSLKVAFQKSNSLYIVILPSLLLSVLFGIRLSYLAFGIGLLLLLIEKNRLFISKKEYTAFLGSQLALAILFQLIWVMGLAASEGGVAAFLQLALGFSAGHFQEWGGTAVSSASSPIWERVFDLIVYNIGWTGLSGHSVLALLLITMIVVYAVLRGFRRQGSWFVWTYFLMFVCYFFWALFAQNIDKPRHILPLPGMLLFACLLSFMGSRKVYGKVCLVMILLLSQMVGTYNMLVEGDKPAAVHKLSGYLSDIEEPLMVYTWEETRVMEYTNVSFNHDRVYTYATFLSQLPYYEDRRIFLTGEVVNGFSAQGAPIHDSIQKVKPFYSSQMYDPVYHKIVLYEYKP